MVDHSHRGWWLRSSVLGALALLSLVACTAETEQTHPEPVVPTEARTTEMSTASGNNQWSDQRAIQQCMQERGWAMELNEGDGSLLAEYPEDQASAHEEDWAECQAQFPPTVIEVSQERAEAYYDALVEAGECLAAHGVDVPAPPSRQASVESMLSGGGVIDPLWDPYATLHEQGLTSTKVADAEQHCPRPEWGVQ